MPNENGGSGGCLCGGVRYRVTGPLSDVGACHCTQCRKTTGHFFAAATCDRSDLVFDARETLAWYRSSAEARRGFCSRCGSSLYWERIGEGRIDVLAGTLDSPTGLKMVDHLYVADKGDYYEITDGLPQYPQHRRDGP